MRVVKAKGHLRGKQPKLSPRQEAHLVELIRSGEYTTSEVGDLFGVARSTVYRALQRSKQRAAVITTAAGAAPRPPKQAQAASQRATLGNSATDAPASYRARHSASEFPPFKRAARRRSPRPQPTPQTGP